MIFELMLVFATVVFAGGLAKLAQVVLREARRAEADVQKLAQFTESVVWDAAQQGPAGAAAAGEPQPERAVG